MSNVSSSNSQGELVPELRFPEFGGEWKVERLSDFATRVTRKNSKNESTLPLTISSKNGLVDQISYFNKTVASKDLSGYYLLKKGEYAYNKSYSVGYNWGSIKRLEHYDMGALSTLYICFSLKNHNSNYINTYFDSLCWYREIQSIAAEGARNHGLLNISTKDFFETKHILPTNIKEQEKIAQFFELITQRIRLQEKLFNYLKSYKRGLLSRLFPKKGEIVPELRFRNFTNDWEQRKLGDNIVEYHEVTTKNNQYPPLTSSRKGIFLQTEYFAGNQIASTDNTGYNIVPFGYFTYRHMSDDEIFHFNINDIVENGIVSTLYPVFTTNENLDSRYLQYQLNYGSEFARFAVLQKQGGARTYMYLNKLKKLYLTMPKPVEEQKKVSTYFMQLDNLITLHQQKLDMCTTVKKYLLQKMFV